jgi:hypothetical protein
MGSSLIEIDDIRLEETVELLLLEDQEVIQAFSSHASQKSSKRRSLAGSGTEFEAL